MKTSRELAIILNKKHRDITRSIQELIKRCPEIKTYFIENTYINNQNYQTYFQYLISEDGVEFLLNKYKFKINSRRPEISFGEELKDYLNELNYSVITQKSVLKYRIDFYIPELNIAIEYDEEQHKYNTEKDNKRQNEIQNILKCKFIRIPIDISFGKALAIITKEIL